MAEEGLHCACLKCILCGLEGDLSYFEEELGLLMVSVVRAAWALIIGHPRVAVIIYAPAMLVVVTGCMGREVTRWLFIWFPDSNSYSALRYYKGPR